MKKNIFILTLLIYYYGLFGFFNFNNRNHSELKWKQLESDNIIIVYHESIKKIATEALAISQESYLSLSKSYDLKLNEKVKIYISDQDEIMNGYSMMGDHIVVWVNQNDFVTHFTGKTKWLRRVIAHEMSHHFVFHSIKNWMDAFIPYGALQFPSDFNEGFAMFFSGEPWGYNRQDASLRKGIFANDLKYETSRGYFYTVGFSMVRYLHAFYGEEKLFDLLRYRNKLKVFDFKEAFKKVYEKDFAVFKEEWRKYIYTYYYGEAYDLKNVSNDDSTKANTLNSLTDLSLKWKSIRNISFKKNKALILGKKSEKQLYYNLVIADLEPDSLTKKKLSFSNEQEIAKIENVFNLNLSENGNFVVFNRYQRFENGSYCKAVYRYDVKNDNLEFKGRGNLVSVNNKGEIIYHTLTKTKNEICILKNNKQRKTILRLSQKSQIGHLILNSNQDKLLLTKYDDGCNYNLEIYDLNSNKKIYNKEFDFMPHSIIWKDNKIVVTIESGKDFRSRILVMKEDSKNWQEYNTPPYNIIPIEIMKSEEKNSDQINLMVYGELKRKNNPIGLISLKKLNLLESQKQVTDNYYTKWITTKYKHPISNNSKPVKNIKESNYKPLNNLLAPLAIALPLSKGLAFASYIMEPLSKHSLTLGGYLPYDFDLKNGWIVTNYTNRCFYPEINLNYMQYKWLGGLIDEEPFYSKTKELSLNFSFPVDYLNKPFWSLKYNIGSSYLDVKKDDKNSTIPETFEEGYGFSVNANLCLGYNLPYLNSNYHPVKMLNFNYKINGSNKDLGMNHNYSHNKINLNFGFSPTHALFDSPFITLINKNNFEWQNGKFIIQKNPGVDGYKDIPAEKLFNNLNYIRGYEQTIVGNKLFNTSNEIWFKLSDKFNENFPIIPSIINVGYLGIGGFYDYANIWQDNKKSELTSYGWELKTAISILGIPTEQKFGQAFDMDGKRLGNYYQLVIPMLIF